MSDAVRDRSFGGMRFSVTRNGLVDAEGDLVDLRPKSLAVFRALAERADCVVGKDELFASVWAGRAVTDDSLVQCVADIRRALGSAGHDTLRTVPGRGYRLVADEPSAAEVGVPGTRAGAEASSGVPEVANDAPSSPTARPGSRRRHVVIGSLVLLGVVVVFWRSPGPEDGEPVEAALAKPDASVIAGPAPPSTAVRDGRPSIAVSAGQGGGSVAEETIVADVVREARLAFGRYRSVALRDVVDADVDFLVRLSPRSSGEGRAGITVDVVDTAEGRVLATEALAIPTGVDDEGAASVASDARTLGVRVAARVASPGGGVIGRYLLESSRSKPVASLTRAECYAYGYGCTTCSGELESITPRAEACLAKALREDPTDARSWALQSTVHAHRYQWGMTLAEPARTDIDARAHLPALALEAANRAEQLSDGADSSVYWGMVQAYGATCRIGRMREAIDRGLAINPDDPNLLAAYGNFLAYAGHWDEGVALVERALEIEPRHYRRWWLFAPAKRHYVRGEYEQALAGFRRAYNERNWLSPLQLAYTLPYLGRMDEAREALADLRQVAPGMTVEQALQVYRTYCFEDDYLERMRDALLEVGLASRGDSSDLDDIRPPVARVIELRGHRVEYMDLGEGVPVVFVHGASSDYRTWGHYQNPVSERRRYISYSRRYYGSQPWPDDGERYSNDTFAADLVALIEALDAGPVFLVSWSSGARSAGIVAATRPDLVRGAIHYEPVLNALQDGDDRVPDAARDRFLSGFGRVVAEIEAGRAEQATEAFLETVFERPAGSFGSEIMFVRQVVHDSWRTLPHVLTPRAEGDTPVDCELLARTEVPTLVVRGETTNAWWRYLARRFAECVPGAEEAELAGVNHAGPVRKPAELFALIDDFVERHSTATDR